MTKDNPEADPMHDTSTDPGPPHTPTEPGPPPSDPPPSSKSATARMRRDDVNRALAAANEVVHVPYEPETGNDALNRILSRVTSAATPPPIQSPTTDGEMAAKYAASDVRPAVRNQTPVPEPSVMLACTGDLMPEGDAAQLPLVGPPRPLTSDAPVAMHAAPERFTSQSEETRPAAAYMIGRRVGTRLGMMLGAAAAAVLLFLVVLVGKVLLHGDARTTATASVGAAAAPPPRAAMPEIPQPMPEVLLSAPLPRASTAPTLPSTSASHHVAPPQETTAAPSPRIKREDL